MWSLTVTVLGILAAAYLWSLMDMRLAEAAQDSIGIETPLTWDKAIKAFTLCMIAGLGVIISGFSLGDVADELVQWFNEYDNDTSQEGTDKKSGVRDTEATSDYYDILFHAAITAYGFITLSAVSIGGYIFAFIFIGFEDNFSCDLQDNDVTAATYDAIVPILKAQTDRHSCLHTIQQVFDIEDLDKDGFISRCEDATMQHALGASKDYAYKFSSAYTRASFNKICSGNFSS